MGDLSLLAEAAAWPFAPGASGVRIARHRDFELLPQRVLQLVADILVFLEEDARVFAALAHALAAEADPRAALFEHALFNAQIDQVAFAEMPSP